MRACVFFRCLTFFSCLLGRPCLISVRSRSPVCGMLVLIWVELLSRLPQWPLSVPSSPLSDPEEWGWGRDSGSLCGSLGGQLCHLRKPQQGLCPVLILGTSWWSERVCLYPGPRNAGQSLELSMPSPLEQCSVGRNRHGSFEKFLPPHHHYPDVQLGVRSTWSGGFGPAR